MVVVFGSVNLDLVFRLPAFPRPGETLLVSGLARLPGGKGANQALAAARAGASVCLAGAVGGDDMAEAATAMLRAGGVDLSRLRMADQPTGCAIVYVDAGAENMIVVAGGANLHADASVVEDTLLGPGCIVVLQHEVPIAQSLTLARRAHDLGGQVIWNAAPAAALPDEVFGVVDLLVVNRSEAQALAARWPGVVVPAEAAVEADQQRFVRQLAAVCGCGILLTLGGAGSLAVWQGRRWRIPALPVEAVDTTGAGDAFVGVLAAALHAGEAPQRAFARAAAAAGLACTAAGAQPALPGAAAIESALDRLPPVIELKD